MNNHPRFDFAVNLSSKNSSTTKSAFLSIQKFRENYMRTLRTLAFAVSTSILLAACSSTPKPEPVKTTGGDNMPPAHKTDTRDVQPMQAGTMDPLDDSKGVLAQRSVYFDFDAYVVKPEYNQLVTAHAKYLESHKARKVIIQGNTDERGGREYNLALSQKRADAVRKGMNTMGVSDAQIEVVSFGKEKPKADGHDEAAWSQNRRADIVYTPNK
jgi:peptidoglycan-associated lipoprotein